MMSLLIFYILVVLIVGTALVILITDNYKIISFLMSGFVIYVAIAWLILGTYGIGILYMLLNGVIAIMILKANKNSPNILDENLTSSAGPWAGYLKATSVGVLLGMVTGGVALSGTLNFRLNTEQHQNYYDSLIQIFGLIYDKHRTLTLFIGFVVLIWIFMALVSRRKKAHV